MPYETLMEARDGGTAIVTLNRPQRRNALSLGLMQELIDVVYVRADSFVYRMNPGETQHVDF